MCLSHKRKGGKSANTRVEKTHFLPAQETPLFPLVGLITTYGPPYCPPVMRIPKTNVRKCVYITSRSRDGLHECKLRFTTDSSHDRVLRAKVTREETSWSEIKIMSPRVALISRGESIMETCQKSVAHVPQMQCDNTWLCYTLLSLHTLRRVTFITSVHCKLAKSLSIHSGKFRSCYSATS